MLEIADDGCGISRDTVRWLFNPGFTTKGVGVSVGLDLSICYQIVEEHHGEIRVESALGKGSTFAIVLPTNPHSVLGVDR